MKRTNCKTKKNITLGDVVKAAHEAGAHVKISLNPKSESEETTDQKNQRLINQAMARKKRLSLDDAHHLAADLMVKRATGKMYRELSEEVRKALETLEHDMKDRARLTRELAAAARDSKDYESCSASGVVWHRAANLVAKLLTWHFPDQRNQMSPDPNLSLP